jgi:hypothetical protein
VVGSSEEDEEARPGHRDGRPGASPPLPGSRAWGAAASAA